MKGFKHFAGYLSLDEQKKLIESLRNAIKTAPLYTPTAPGGKLFNIKITSCGILGWTSDHKGYRYEELHPLTKKPWPKIPEQIYNLAKEIAPSLNPESCLINFYTESGKLGLHQDRDEKNLSAPILSISLGDSGIFTLGGLTRNASTRDIRVNSGDILLLAGESRLAFHGIKAILPGTAPNGLLKAPGRINLTIRQVN